MRRAVSLTLARTAVPTAADAARHVASACRRRRPDCARSPPPAHARPYNIPRSASPFFFPSFRLASSRAHLTPPHAEPLAGAGNSVRSSSPSATTPRHEHRFALLQSLLASARRAKLSRRRNGSPEFGRCSRSALLRGACPSALPRASCSSATAPHQLTGTRELFPAP
jgi:hypothetical protein